MWLRRVFCGFLLSCAFCRADDGDSRIVTIDQGPVRGYRHPSGGLFIFYNIPYATAPSGKDKFKGPLPGPKWMDTYDAVDRGVVCPQNDMLINVTTGKNRQENCLIANVYVPDTEEKNLPVIFQVHGGAYHLGWGNMLESKYLVKSKKVIVVNVNYRLGIHGFLCLGTPDAPGNAGMKDLVAALRWVNENIANFGGNPDDVTIQGFSAGSSAVDLLLLSKSTVGLFHKAIPESGANVATWSVQIDPLNNAKDYVKKYGFDVEVDDLYALQEFYKNAPYELLIKNAFMERTDNDFGFAPCIERHTGVEKFLDDYPVNILKNRKYTKVPMLYGFSNMEGLLRLEYGYEMYKNGMNDRFSDFLPSDLQFQNADEKEKLAKKIKEFYFGDKTIGEETISGFVDYFTDITFAYPHLRSLTLQVEAGNNKIYLYEYAFPQEFSVPGTSTKVLGANHCAQSMSVSDGIGQIGDPGDESALSEDFKKMKAIMREIWFNFITTGTPSGSALPGQWPPAGADRSPYMELTLTPTLRGELLPRRARFWDALYDKYYRAPAPPPTISAKRNELTPSGSALPGQWPPAGADRSPYMELTLTPTLRGELLPRRARFWDALYDKYYRAPAPPPTISAKRNEL